MEADGDPSDDPRRLVAHHERFPTLQAIASNSIARKVLTNVLGGMVNDRSRSRKRKAQDHLVDELISKLEHDFVTEATKVIDSFALTRYTEEALKQSVKKVVDEMENCIDHFRNKLFLERPLSDYNVQLFDWNWCVWMYNGEIDHRRTAFNMLNSGMLNKMQEFSIMCEFCMEDVIGAVRYGLLSTNFIHFVNWRRPDLQFYWICRLTDKMHRIQLLPNESLYYTMARKCVRKPWIAFTYFWDFLGADDQVSLACQLIDFNANGDVARSNHDRMQQLLVSMSWHQQNRVLQVKAIEIILNFCVHLDSPQSAIWAWTHSKDIITEEQFVFVVRIIVDKMIRNNKGMYVLNHVWTTAADNLKKYAINEALIEEILTKFLFESYVPTSPPCPAALLFLRSFFASMDANRRKTTIIEMMPKFAITHHDPRLFNAVIVLCLPKAEDRLKFVNSVANYDKFKTTCEMLVRESQFPNLKARLEFYLPNEQAVRERVDALLKLGNVRLDRFMFDLTKWTDLCNYIDSLFVGDQTDAALKMKKSVITTFVSNHNNHEESAYRKQYFDGLVEVVESVFKNEALAIFKQELLETMRNKFSDKECWNNEYKFFVNCVQWCLDDDEEAIRNFKSNVLTVTEIFDATFRYLAKKSIYAKVTLMRLDKYLKWYLNSNEEVKKYKARRISKPAEFAIFTKYFNQNTHYSWAQVQELLKWFFENDAKAIAEFKSKNREFVCKLPEKKY